MMIRTVFTASLMLLPLAMATADDNLNLDNEAQSVAVPAEATEATAAVVQAVADDPASQEADAAAPTAEAPVAEAPVAEAPVAETAVADANVAENSVVEAATGYPQSIASDESAVIASETSPAAPVKYHRHYSAPSQRSSGGVFSELIELERRKNAWLKRTFLGR